MVDYEPMKLDFIRSYDPEPNPDKESLQEAAELINNAQRPLVLVGQGVELGNVQDEPSKEVYELFDKAEKFDE